MAIPIGILSEKFGNKYFHENDAKIIGYIRDDLEEKRKKISGREFYIILTSLMYETDKIANTCGHFESFLNKHLKYVGLDGVNIPETMDLPFKRCFFQCTQNGIAYVDTFTYNEINGTQSTNTKNI